MIRQTIYASLLLLILLLAGCGGTRTYDNISSDVKYAHLIGTQYKTLQKLRLQGVTLDRNYRKKIDVYNVGKYPGSSGPEIILGRELQLGSIIKVKAVLRCNNCPFGSLITVEIEILSEDLEDGVPIRLYTMLVEDAAGRVILDPKFLIQIDGIDGVRVN